MTGVLDTLDGLANGTDVAVVQASRVERWKVLDGGLCRDGVDKRVDPWFFAGLMNEGAVMLGDFTPPAVGEWWVSTYERAVASVSGCLVLATEGVNATVAVFRRGHWYEWRVDRNLLDDAYVRGEPPEWVSAPYLAMTQMAYEANRSRLESEATMRQYRDARYNLAYAKDYLDRAVNAITDNERRR